MNGIVSENTQAILLLTAPLIAGRGDYSSERLSAGEYNSLAILLAGSQREPADLLSPEAGDILKQIESPIDSDRLNRLLSRGFLLSQVVEKWEARSIWVVSRADPGYPSRLKERLRSTSPAVLYGCGDAAILETGGIAIVGSRNADPALVEYTESIGHLAARAGKTVISGGARGIDQAAMSGALLAGGRSVGVLSDSLNRRVISRDVREYLMENQLVLICPYDPAAGFTVGNAMSRNKVIYALADAALAVSSARKKGGTWAGAAEQLDKYRQVPVYVRPGNDATKGLAGLREKGALIWPDPQDADAFIRTLDVRIDPLGRTTGNGQLALLSDDRATGAAETAPEPTPTPTPGAEPSRAAEQLFAKVRELALQMNEPMTEAGVTNALEVSAKQSKEWLRRLVKEGVLTKKQKPVRYVFAPGKQKSLLDIQNQKG